MSKAFLKNIAFDILLWSGIWFGLFGGNNLIANATIFLVWLMVAICFMSTFANDDMLEKLAKDRGKRGQVHCFYSNASCFLEIMALAALGYFVTAAAYAFGCMIMISLAYKLDGMAEGLGNENN